MVPRGGPRSSDRAPSAARAVLGVVVGIEAVRGTVLDEPLAVGAADVAPRVLVTTHPSAVLRLRGKEGWSEAFGRLVDDLRVAASLIE